MADQATFAELATPYMSALYAAALRMTRNPSDAERTAETEALAAMPDDEVKKALESIPEQFRMAVILADIEGFSYKEIAEILDVPIGTVMSRIHRGRRQLQKLLWDYATEHNLRPRVETTTGG